MRRFIMAATLLSAFALGLLLTSPTMASAQGGADSITGALNGAVTVSAQDGEGESAGDELPGSIVGSGARGSDSEETGDEESGDLPGSIVGSGGTGGDTETAAEDVMSMPSTGVGSSVSTSIGLTGAALALFAVAATMTAATSMVYARRA